MGTTQDHSDLFFLQELHELGIFLHEKNGALVCKAKPGVLTGDIQKRIALAKPRLLSLLAGMQKPDDLVEIVPDPESRYEPFPLTENQEAYWLGRGSEQESGQVGIHIYFEVLCKEFNTERFHDAWRQVVDRHDMLRAQVTPQGQQVILQTPPDFSINQYNRAGETEAGWQALKVQARDDLSQKCYNLEQWPQFTFTVFHEGNDALLLGSIDCWANDGRSLQIIFQDLERLYKGETLPPLPDIKFRDYVIYLENMRSSSLYEQSWQYWQQRIPSLPQAPQLPLAVKEKAPIPRFVRKSARLKPDQLQRLRQQARKNELTMASLLLACYTEVLSKWSEHKHFTINVPRWNRLPVHPEINSLTGEFASFSLMEVDRRSPRPFLEHALSVQRQMWQDLQHGYVSGVAVLREWRRVMKLTPGALVPYVFTSEPETESGQIGSWLSAVEGLGRVGKSLTQTPQVWIDSQYAVVDDSLNLYWDVDESIFPAGLPGKMFAAYVTLLEDLADTPETWSNCAPVPLPEDERKRRGTLDGAKVTVDLCTPWEKLSQHAVEQGGRPAVSDSAGTLTWREFKEEVDLWRSRLASLEVGQGTPVAIALPKSRWQSIACLAVHSLGAVIIPLDYELPSARAVSILQNSGSRLLLTNGTTQWDVAAAECRVVDITEQDTAWPTISAQGLEKLRVNAAPLDKELYCVIYTSGSTGVPKGVMVPLRGILNMMQDARERFVMTAQDAILSLSPMHHDLALFDIVGSVLAGSHTVYPDPALLRDPEHWVALMLQHKVTLWNTVPAMMTMLLDYAESGATPKRLPDLRFAVLGGDWLPLATPGRLARTAPSCTLVSSGGPTETTGWNILYAVKNYNPEWKSIPYGTPIQNVSYHIWDAHGQDCPERVTGELYCSGEGITAGYLHDAEKSRKAYLKHPWTSAPVFRTGDLGKLHPEGFIEFVGRRDKQINLNGYRIELGEVESALTRHAAIAQAVACVYSTTKQQDEKNDPNELPGLPDSPGLPGSPGLLNFIGAWVTCKPGQARPEEKELKQYLQQLLPRHMQPKFIALADSFPLTANNKTNRQAISAWAPPEARQGLPPSSPVELLVADAWKEILQKPVEDIQQNFFEAGGDSIAAVRLYTCLHAKGLPQIQVSTIFSCPSIQELARFIEDKDETPAGPSYPLLLTQTHGKLPPATKAQERIWLEEQMQPGRTNNILHFAIEVAVSRPDTPAAATTSRLENALNTVIARHGALRTSFVQHQDQLCQSIQDEIAFKLSVIDLRDQTNHENHLAGLRDEMALSLFDLSKTPLMRARLVLLADNKHQLLIAFHHAVFDGWSMGIFMKDLTAAFGDTELSVPQAALADIACWENERQTIQAEQQTLNSMQVEFPQGGAPASLWEDQTFGLTRPGQQTQKTLPGLPDTFSTGQTAEYGNITLSFPVALTGRLASLAAKAGVTEFMSLCSLFGLTLSKATGKETVQIGTYVSTRFSAKLDHVIGAMINPVPLTLHYDHTQSILESLRNNGKALAKVQERSLVPFDRLVRTLAPPRKAGEHPLFSIAFSQDNSPADSYEAPGLSLRLLPGKQYSTALDLEISLMKQTDGTQQASLTFNSRKFSRDSMQRLLERFMFIAGQAAESPLASLASLEISTPDEQQSLKAWNATQSTYPYRSNLLEPFAEMVSKYPEQRSILGGSVLGDSNPSYKELLASAQSLARLLTSRGVNQGDYIGLHLSPGVDFVIAMLASWWCGAAFLPLADTLPIARLRKLALMARTKIILTTPEHREDWQTGAIPVLDCKEALEYAKGQPRTEEFSAPRQLSAENIACLIFTSGSTGEPKGVPLSHAGLLNRIQWLWRTIPKEPDDVWCAKAALSFVDCLCELLCPLLQGSKLYICSTREASDPFTLAQAVAQHRVTRLTLVPSVLSAILDEQERSAADLSSLRHVVTSGEALSGQLAQRFHKALPKVALYNFYGSTEISADALWHKVLPTATNPVPIGKPIANVEAFVMNPQRKPLPCGIPGEICIAGAALSPGYLNLNSPAFFSHNSTPHFATGDLGVWTPKGEILYLGRIDRQLKIRGQRIEPAEVEYAIKQLPGVKDVVVFAFNGRINQHGKPEQNGNESHSGQTLAAAVVPEQGATPSPEALRKQLLPLLPGAAIPSRFIFLEAMPKTGSGKVDIVTLQETIARSVIATETKLSGKTQTSLASLWSELLGAAPHSLQADFFSSGGHSLLASRMSNRLREEFGVPLQAKHLFEFPVFADLAAVIDLLAANLHQPQNPQSLLREVEEF